MGRKEQGNCETSETGREIRGQKVKFRISDLGRHKAWGMEHGEKRGQKSEVGRQKAASSRQVVN